jgi:hypothetical protein
MQAGEVQAIIDGARQSRYSRPDDHDQLDYICYQGVHFIGRRVPDDEIGEEVVEDARCRRCGVSE